MRVGIDMSFSSLRGSAQRDRDLKSAPPALASPAPRGGTRKLGAARRFLMSATAAIISASLKMSNT